MSYPIIDYLPFNYERYLHEILPLWERALGGDVYQLKTYIQAASHFSLWPHINCPLTIETEMMERLFSDDLEPLRKHYHVDQSETARVTLWNILLPLLDALDAGSDPARLPGLKFLHSSLLYTFCCDLPPEEEGVWQMVYDAMMMTSWGGTIVLGHEEIPIWQEYIGRDAATRRLWEPFTSPPPQELIGSLLFPERYPSELVAHEPRSMFKYRLDVGIHGLLTRAETRQIFKEYRRKESPLLAAIRGACLRDAAQDELPLDLRHLNLRLDYPYRLDMSQEMSAEIWKMDLYYSLYFENQEVQRDRLEQIVSDELWKAYPERMNAYQQRYYEMLWKVEERVMKRVELAASRGWGFMMMQG